MNSLIEFDHKKATQAINFFAIEEGGKISKLKTVKLIWLADRYHLRKYGRPIVNDTYYAMQYGPVGSSVKDLAGFDVYTEDEEKYLNDFLKLKSNNVIKSKKALDDEVFSDSDIEALETVYKEYGKYGPFDLVDISHDYPEWNKFKKTLKSRESTREIIQYIDFFGNPSKDSKVKDIFNESKEQLESTKSIFEDNYKIANFWV